ncbi:MAG: hypothetical protein K1X83_05935 [Oligoflexia bacterium]|nr:hypothetical protein [Oligoflexia bacterium]
MLQALRQLALSLTLFSAVALCFQLPGRERPIEIERIFELDPAETTLALGQKLLLSAASIYELELIKGVSDTLAFKIERAKAQLTICEKKSARSPLQAIKGIGQKTAQKLEQHLELGCESINRHAFKSSGSNRSSSAFQRDLGLVFDKGAVQRTD